MGEEKLVGEALAALRDNRSDAVPDAEELTAGFEEEVFVEQAMIEECTGLVPIADHHHEGGACFGSRCGKAHAVVQVVGEVVLEEPVACLAKPGLAAHLKDLQM